MASSACTIHALLYAIFMDHIPVKPARVLVLPVAALCMIAPRIYGYAFTAFSSVCTHNIAFMFVFISKPITPESKPSNTTKTYRFPSLALISVMSVTHFFQWLVCVKITF